MQHLADLVDPSVQAVVPARQAKFYKYMQVQQLLEMGADVGAKDKKGISALHYASGQGRLEVLQFLWSKGLDLDADDPGKLPFLQSAGPLMSCTLCTIARPTCMHGTRWIMHSMRRSC